MLQATAILAMDSNVAAAVPDLKDAMVAIIGAGVALAGLLLIFSGYLYAQAAVMPTTTRNETLKKYRLAARLALLPFAASLVLAGLASAYWLAPSPQLGTVAVVLFMVLIFGTVVYGIWATGML